MTALAMLDFKDPTSVFPLLRIWTTSCWAMLQAMPQATEEENALYAHATKCYGRLSDQTKPPFLLLLPER